jgi:hypothetical protein
MPRTIDVAPISVTRTHRTQRFEIQFDDTGALVNILAHRWVYTRNAGNTDQTPPLYLGAITLVLADFTAAQKTQLNQTLTMVEAVIDPKDAIQFP